MPATAGIQGQVRARGVAFGAEQPGLAGGGLRAGQDEERLP
jgi:hypothetical protein